jgi:uncharacterized protein YjiS (DUF1127 family)
MFKLATFPNFPFVLATTRRPRRNRMTEFWAGLAEGLAMRAQYEGLAQLSKPDLARLGLTRDDITRMVARGRK